MHAWINAAEAAATTPLVATDSAHFDALIASLGDDAASFCKANGFRGENGRFLGIPGIDGKHPLMLVGCNASSGIFALASLPRRLPPGDYALDRRGIALDPADAALGWALGAYRFARYRKPTREAARLLIDEATRAKISSLAHAATLTRDLINTPTQDMGPADLAGAVRALAERHACDYREWVGDELLRDNFPTIHAVGRAATAERAPRLAMLSHGPTTMRRMWCWLARACVLIPAGSTSRTPTACAG